MKEEEGRRRCVSTEWDGDAHPAHLHAVTLGQLVVQLCVVLFDLLVKWHISSVCVECKCIHMHSGI